MKSARLLLALAALFPLSAILTASPAAAQAAACRWDLNGEWVGQRTGNRVMIEMRAGGFVSWVPGAPKPGQDENNNKFNDAGSGAWDLTFPNGMKAIARLEGGLLRIRNPDGWTDTFNRVRPAGAPRCAPIGGSAAGTAPNRPQTNAALPARPLNGPAGNRIVSGVTHADMKELIESEGHTVKSLGTYQGEGGATNLEAIGVMPDGTRYLIFGKDCSHAGVSRCARVQFMISYTDDRVRAEHILESNSKNDGVNTAWFASDGKTIITFSWQMPMEQGVPMRVLRSGFKDFLLNQAKAWGSIFEKLS